MGVQRRWWRRAVLGVAAGAAVFFALAWPLRRVELVCLREMLRGMERVGIMDTRKGLGGQVMGYNFARDPAWAHWVAGGLAAGMAYAPAVVAGVAVMRRVGRIGERGVTRCGGCGGVLRGLREARCPHCGRGL